MSELSPALAAVSFDQMTAVSALGERLVFEFETPNEVNACCRCLFYTRPCEYARRRTFCGDVDRRDKRFGLWRPAP